MIALFIALSKLGGLALVISLSTFVYLVIKAPKQETAIGRVHATINYIGKSKDPIPQVFIYSGLAWLAILVLTKIFSPFVF